jgi:phospholipid-binding lipoprotein MlaA
MLRLSPPLLALAALLAMPACATRPPADDPEALAEFRTNNDPIEPTNRVLLQVHEAVDQAVLEPVARAYREVVPRPVRTGVRNALGNLRAPVILLNDALQGERQRAEITLGRFMINSTLGLGGLIDVAAMIGVPGHAEDFGQTLAVWGVGEGPYLFIPVLGPSNPRDLSGSIVDIAANPVSYIGQGGLVDAFDWTRIALTVVDTREGLLDAVEQVRATSLDPYATIRSAYRQRRRAEIENRTDAPPAAGGTGYGVGLGIAPVR